MSKPFLERLDQTARELRGVATATVAQLTVAAAIGLATLLIVVDWVGRFNDTGLRWVFTATLLGVTAGVAVAAWRRFRPTDDSRLGVAQRLQAARPELGSRLASAVEFAESDADDPTAGSAELRRAVVLDAATGVEGLPFDEVIDRTPRRRATRWLLGAFAAMAAFGLANASAVTTGLYRLAAPWANAPWPRTVSLQAVEAPTKLARGAPFEATAVNELGPIPDDTRIEYRLAASGDQPSRTEAAPTQLVGEQAIATRVAAQRSFAYRFVGGDDDTMDWIELDVIDPPVASRLAITIEPPAYSGLPTDESSGPLRVLAGTALTLRGESDKPLTAAELVVGEGDPVALASDDGSDRRFATGDAPWLAAVGQGGEYVVRLTGTSGVTGVAGPHRYEVIADTPPAVEWDSGSEDAVVTSRAVVPLRGVVTDNLAIQRVQIEWSAPADGPDGEPPAAQRETLADSGPVPPPSRSLNEADSQEIDYAWDLAPLGVSPGDELLVSLLATDYQPDEGRTTTPRRVLVVTDEEFLSRLAESQSRLLGQVQQALASQRDARTATSDLDTDTRSAEAVDRAALDRLTSIEFQQREATAVVADPTTGARATAQRLREALQRSRLEAPELASQLASAAESLGEIAERSMPAARSDLAAARRAGKRATDAEAGATEEFGQRLADAGTQQEDAIDRLEQVAELLTSWADYQRFAGEAAALEQLERDLASEAQRQAAAMASRLMVDPTRAEREKLLTRQAEATRRFDKLRQAMKRLLDSQPNEAEPTSATQSVGDALAEADDADVGGQLRAAARDLARGKAGAASESQQAAAEGLKSMVEALRQRTTTDPEELAKRLAEEKQKLGELQERVEQLQRQPDTRQNRAARKQVAERASRQGRRLERLTASQAAASTQQGAEQAGGERQPGDQQQQLAKAEESFEQAQEEIDQRLRELDNQQTQRLLDQLAERIDGYIDRQTDVIDRTLELDTAVDRPVQEPARELSLDQQDLSDELGDFAEKLAKRAVFELALGGAARATDSAAERLDDALVDKRTQRLETSALGRLEQIKEVLEQTPQPPQENQGGGGGGGGDGGEPPPPSPVDVAELKMLRLMQLEVLSRTDAYEADTATARRTRQPLPEGWRKAGESLARQQRRLAELALELSERDNDPEAETE